MSTIKKRTFRVLDAHELQTINGGNSTESTSMSLSSGSSGVDNLLSMEFNWQQGDRSRHYKLEVGKEVQLGLNIFGSGQNL